MERVVQSRSVTRMPQASEGFAVERDIYVEAPPETVFTYFTDPEKMTRWKGSEAQLDPKPGGVYRVTVMPEAIACGEYLVVDPPTRVVFTWGWEGEGQPVPPGTSTVEVTFEPEGKGTRVRLLHTSLPTDEMKVEHTKGWDHYLPRLAEAVSA